MQQLDKKFHGYILRSLRRVWGWYPERTKARQRAEIGKNVYRCEGCGIIAIRKDTEVDHVDSVIPVTGFDNYHAVIVRMFCAADGLKVLCKTGCHRQKTLKDNAERRKVKKNAVHS